MAIAQLLVPTAYGHCRTRVFFDKGSPHGFCESAIRGRINTFCLFFSALCDYLSTTDLADFHRFFASQRTFRMRKIRADPLRRRRIKNQAVGSGARVKNP